MSGTREVEVSIFVIHIGPSSEEGASYLLTVDYGEGTFLWSTYLDLDPEADCPTPYSVQSAFLGSLEEVMSERLQGNSKETVRDCLSIALDRIEAMKKIPHRIPERGSGMYEGAASKKTFKY